jgi:methylated-DNA-[protein]-cysteine S-methyltransferase
MWNRYGSRPPFCLVMNGIVYYKSPVGELAIESEDEQIVSTEFLRTSRQEEVSTPVIRQCVLELEEYFHAGRKFFNVPLLIRGTEFQKKVWTALLDIPFGQTRTYSDIANCVGDLKSVRAVGLANGQNPFPVIVPCHRVIGKDGSLVGYGGGLDKKQWLLQHEGVMTRQMDMFAPPVSAV